jgi:hypothetical protein
VFSREFTWQSDGVEAPIQADPKIGLAWSLRKDDKTTLDDRIKHLLPLSSAIQISPQQPNRCWSHLRNDWDCEDCGLVQAQNRQTR